MGDLGTDIIVYSPIASARLNYIVKLLFQGIIDLEILEIIMLI